MAEWFASGRVIDAILLLVALEAMGLAALKRFTGLGPGLASVWPILLSGVCLLLAVRAALIGAPWMWISAALLAGLAAHILDLLRRA